jgi:hypothetical protein
MVKNYDRRRVAVLCIFIRNSRMLAINPSDYSPLRLYLARLPVP